MSSKHDPVAESQRRSHDSSPGGQNKDEAPGAGLVINKSIRDASEEPGKDKVSAAPTA